MTERRRAPRRDAEREAILCGHSLFVCRQKGAEKGIPCPDGIHGYSLECIHKIFAALVVRHQSAFRSKTDGLVHLLRRESMSKGVKIIYHEDDSISIELHIIVDNGVNLVAVSRSIQSEVKYNVNRLTGIEVRSVNVCVDSMVIG